MTEALISLIAESFRNVWGRFDDGRFIRKAGNGLEALAFSARGRQVDRALKTCLPKDFGSALPIFLNALGPPLGETEKFGLKPFFYFQHSHNLAQSSVEHVDAGLQACYYLTKWFMADNGIDTWRP